MLCCRAVWIVNSILKKERRIRGKRHYALLLPSDPLPSTSTARIISAATFDVEPVAGRRAMGAGAIDEELSLSVCRRPLLHRGPRGVIGRITGPPRLLKVVF